MIKILSSILYTEGQCTDMFSKYHSSWTFLWEDYNFNEHEYIEVLRFPGCISGNVNLLEHSLMNNQK